MAIQRGQESFLECLELNNGCFTLQGRSIFQSGVFIGLTRSLSKLGIPGIQVILGGGFFHPTFI